MSKKSRCNKCKNITGGTRDLDIVTHSGTHTASYKLCSHIPSPVLPTLVIIWSRKEFFCSKLPKKAIFSIDIWRPN